VALEALRRRVLAAQRRVAPDARALARAYDEVLAGSIG